MGTFKVEIQAVGGHGCQREIKDGGTVTGCGQMYCPDCQLRGFLRQMKHLYGWADISAKLIHWPGQSGEVTDDLVSGKRTGSF